MEQMSSNENLLKTIAEKNLPPIPDDLNEVRELLQNEIYGRFPTDPCVVTASEPKRLYGGFPNFDLSEVILTVQVRGREFSFPIKQAIHRDGRKRPFFILNNFRPDQPDLYCPLEEIEDNEFDLISVCYKDITSDDGDFTNGVADIFVGGNDRSAHECGKIVLWAWANMRVLDYAQTIPCLDTEHAAVVGHSRLGKTALVTGAFDSRFRYIFSNNAGCSGDAANRLKGGESVEDITRVFPYWFCPHYRDYAGKEDQMPFDQHFLIAACYPRCVCVGASSLDSWADPQAEYLTVGAASEYYERNGKVGFICPDRLPVDGEKMLGGTLGYHLKAGPHYFSRHDWNRYMEFVRRHWGD